MKNKIVYSVSAVAIALTAAVALPAFAQTEADASVSASTTLRMNGPRPAVNQLIKNRVETRVENRIEKRVENRIEERQENRGEIRDGKGNIRAGMTASSTVKARMGNASSTNPQAIERAKAKANQEIERRIKSLTDLSERISNMKRVSASAKTSLSATVQAEITKLTTLKAKIAADTDMETLRTDIKSITASYRIYALIMPQLSILAAADRVNVIVENFNTVIAKLQARINEAAAAGKDTSAMVSALASITAKVGDAKVQADAAVNAVTSLTPDNGDKSKMETNTAALKDARNKIKTANDELRAARKEMDTIIKGTRGINAQVTVSATTTATTTP